MPLLPSIQGKKKKKFLLRNTSNKSKGCMCLAQIRRLPCQMLAEGRPDSTNKSPRICLFPCGRHQAGYFSRPQQCFSTPGALTQSRAAMQRGSAQPTCRQQTNRQAELSTVF